jgi:hypothetical protein
MKPPENVLFIGGVADGEWKPDLGLKYCKIASFTKIPHPRYSATESPVEVAPVEVSAYRRELFRTDGREFAVYVHDNLTVTKAFGKLLKGYRPCP